MDPNDERLKGLDPKLIETISHEIMDRSPSITWDDIAGINRIIIFNIQFNY